MPFIGIINGIFRQTYIIKHVNDLRAHQISTVTLVALMAIYIYAIFKKVSISNYKQAWIVGLVWLLLTISFEFCLGFFISHLTLEQMLADYNVFDGRLWPFVLLSLLFLPVLYHRLFTD
jgi:cell shape-determining protein MreD